MTENEAIELIEKDLKLHSKDLSGKYKNSLRMAINALEKQIPKKPLNITKVKDGNKYVGLIGKCPCCNDIVDESNIICDCGQKLDWSDEQ